MSARERVRENRINLLIEQFDQYVNFYDQNVPFRRSGQFEHHERTLALRRSFTDVSIAIHADEFVTSLWNTLKAWCFGVRSSRLHGPDAFRDELRLSIDALTALEGILRPRPTLIVMRFGDSFKESRS